MIVVDPPLMPLTVVDARALVAPWGIKMFAGHSVAIDGLLLASVMDTPPAGATVPNDTGKLTVSPAAIVRLGGRTIFPGPDPDGAALTLAVALAMFDVLAVIVTNPVPTPVTGTDTVALPAPKLTVAGTVTTVGSLDFRLTASAAVAGTDRLSVRFCVMPSVTVRLPGQKLIVVTVPPPVTCTWVLAVA